MIKPITALASSAAFLALAGSANAQTAKPSVAEGGFSEIFDCSTVASETDRLSCYDAAVGRLRAAQSSGEVAVVRRDAVEAVERDGFGFSMPALPRLKNIFGGSRKSGDTSNAGETQVAVVTPEPNRKRAITGRGALTAPVDRPAPSPVPDAAPVEAVRIAEAQAAASRTALPTPLVDIDKVEIGLKRTKTLGYKKQRFYLENGQVWDQTDSQTVRLPKQKEDRQSTVEIRRGALGSYLLRIDGAGKAIRVRRRQ